MLKIGLKSWLREGTSEGEDQLYEVDFGSGFSVLFRVDAACKRLYQRH